MELYATRHARAPDAPASDGRDSEQNSIRQHAFSSVPSLRVETQRRPRAPPFVWVPHQPFVWGFPPNG
jgi:hypothetical protein